MLVGRPPTTPLRQVVGSTGWQIHRSTSPHHHAATPRTVNRRGGRRAQPGACVLCSPHNYGGGPRDWPVGGGVEGHRSGCWRRGRPTAVCESEHNGRNVGAYGRVTGSERGQKCLSPLAARVEGMCGWPTLYGKSGRRTDHHILYGSPPVHFRTTERLRAGLWAREGRWYYVEGERQLISAAGSPPTLLPCQAGHLSVTGGAQVLRGLASGTGVPAHPGPLVFLPRGWCVLWS